MKEKNLKLSKKQITAIVVCAVLVVLAVIGAIFAKSVYDDFKGKSPDTDVVVINISDLDDASEVSAKLEDADVIKYGFAFNFYVSMQNTSRHLLRGEVSVVKGESYAQVFDRIFEPLSEYTPREVVDIRIPEGSEVTDIIEIFVENGIGTVESFEQAIETHDFGYDYIPEPGTDKRLEGYLFPDTYEFYKDSNPEEALQKLVDTFDAKINSDEMQAMISASDMSLRDIIILASIIEKESGTVSDMPLISSVFHNRLDIDMLLQSCATLNYTFPKAERTLALSAEQLQIDSPYNTYMYKGLPPTPIANPSLAAIRAAVDPQNTDYLYFCAKGDGTSAFASTYEQHQQNIETYRDNW